MQGNYETLISLEEMAISLPRITALAESHRRGLASGFPLSKPDLLSWMDRGEDLWVPELQESEGREILKEASPGDDLSRKNEGDLPQQEAPSKTVLRAKSSLDGNPVEGESQSTERLGSTATEEKEQLMKLLPQTNYLAIKNPE
uniref:Uncharacterized protein n=1 Tax=Sphaerodactylus townsendi TaxID=933632 RepID=A0ACB8EGU8_9SAUR